MQIHQILPDIAYGDAISNYTVELRDALRELGYESNIYAARIHPTMKDYAINYREYPISGEKRVLIFHFSIGSEITSFIKDLSDKRILIYHNITPHTYFPEFNKTLAKLLKSGRDELREISNIIDYALGDSEYNRRELVNLGFKKTGVLPIFINFNGYNQEPDNSVIEKFQDDYINFIFVGRISPNKRQEDIIKIFYCYNRFINRRSRLFLIGSYIGLEKYYWQLRNLAKKLGLEESIHFLGHVSSKELLAFYKLADIFICMSEHEGFCVPLLESMYFGIPIMAFNSSAIPYTLDKSGVLINKKCYIEIAEMANIVIEDTKLRSKIVNSQNIRLNYFTKDNVIPIFKRYIEEVID